MHKKITHTARNALPSFAWIRTFLQVFCLLCICYYHALIGCDLCAADSFIKLFFVLCFFRVCVFFVFLLFFGCFFFSFFSFLFKSSVNYFFLANESPINDRKNHWSCHFFLWFYFYWLFFFVFSVYSFSRLWFRLIKSHAADGPRDEKPNIVLMEPIRNKNVQDHK